MQKTTLSLLAGASLLFATPALAGPAGPSYTPDLLPPDHTPGQCYARVKIPAQYETRSETVMTEAPSSTVRVTQPKFQSRQEKVLVKEPSVRFEVRQPTFRSVSEQIVTRPAYDRLSVTPPRFTTESETLTMSEPRLVWKKGNPNQLRAQGYTIHSTADAGRMGKGYSSTTQYGTSGGANCGSTCEIWCLVEEPGTRQTFQRRVMSAPGGVSRTRVPARTETITRQVVADPGGVREVPVPGEYRTVTVEDLVDPGGEYTENTPPKYGQVQGKVLVEPERYEWRRVVCAPGTAGYSGRSHGSSHSSLSHGGSYGTAPTIGYSQPLGGGVYSSGSRYSSGSHASGSTSPGATYRDAYPFPTSPSGQHSSGSHSSGGHGGGGYAGGVYDQPAYGSEPLAGGYRR